MVGPPTKWFRNVDGKMECISETRLPIKNDSWFKIIFPIVILSILIGLSIAPIISILMSL